jgi:hypothetical protein
MRTSGRIREISSEYAGFTVRPGEVLILLGIWRGASFA